MTEFGSFVIWRFIWLVVVCETVLCYGSSCNFDGDVVDKTAIARLDEIKDKTFSTEGKDGGTTLKYRYRLCSNPDSQCKDMGYANVVEEDAGGNCVVIGSYNETNIKADVEWVSMSYRGSPVQNMSEVKRYSVVTFICDHNSGEDKFTLAHIDHCQGHRVYYSFIITSPNVCTKTGLSGGSVFCILLFTVFGVYLLFGFLYRRVIIRAKGFEQIPNYDSWREFGNLIADGCDFLCRCNSRQSNKLYQGIDDSFSHPNENEGGGDDHLLPM